MALDDAGSRAVKEGRFCAYCGVWAGDAAVCDEHVDLLLVDPLAPERWLRELGAVRIVLARVEDGRLVPL